MLATIWPWLLFAPNPVAGHTHTHLTGTDPKVFENLKLSSATLHGAILLSLVPWKRPLRRKSHCLALYVGLRRVLK